MELKLKDDFREFLRSLNDHHVRYLVVGGYAVGLHGYPRGTRDLDIWVSPDAENVVLVVQMIREFGFELSDADATKLLRPNQIFQMGIEPVQIEVFSSITGVEFDECYESRAVIDFDGEPTNVIGLPHLIQAKRASGRHRDLDDIENLE